MEGKPYLVPHVQKRSESQPESTRLVVGYKVADIFKKKEPWAIEVRKRQKVDHLGIHSQLQEQLLN